MLSERESHTFPPLVIIYRTLLSQNSSKFRSVNSRKFFFLEIVILDVFSNCDWWNQLEGQSSRDKSHYYNRWLEYQLICWCLHFVLQAECETESTAEFAVNLVEFRKQWLIWWLGIMGGTRIFEVGAARGQGGRHRGTGRRKLLLSYSHLKKTSSRCFGRQRPEIKWNSTLTVQCFDTFRGFLHKIHDDWGAAGRQGIGHKGAAATPLAWSVLGSRVAVQNVRVTLFEWQVKKRTHGQTAAYRVAK